MLLFSCMHVEKKHSYSFLLLCVPCQEITQDCTQSLLRNHLNYVRRRRKIIYTVCSYFHIVPDLFPKAIY